MESFNQMNQFLGLTSGGQDSSAGERRVCGIPVSKLWGMFLNGLSLIAVLVFESLRLNADLETRAVVQNNQEMIQNNQEMITMLMHHNNINMTSE